MWPRWQPPHLLGAVDYHIANMRGESAPCSFLFLFFWFLPFPHSRRLLATDPDGRSRSVPPGRLVGWACGGGVWTDGPLVVLRHDNYPFASALNRHSCAFACFKSRLNNEHAAPTGRLCTSSSKIAQPFRATAHNTAGQPRAR